MSSWKEGGSPRSPEEHQGYGGPITECGHPSSPGPHLLPGLSHLRNMQTDALHTHGFSGVLHPESPNGRFCLDGVKCVSSPETTGF